MNHARPENLNSISQDLFGGNTVYSRNTNDGQISDQYDNAINNLGIGSLRYPAGQPEKAFANGLLINGSLPSHLTDFLDWAVKEGRSVVIVTPTWSSYSGPKELEAFATAVLEQYGSTIAAFEIGNEYWGEQSETEYGIIANESAIAISSAAEIAKQPQTEIWVQMADPSGKKTDFDKTFGTWDARIIAANQAIIDQLSDAARSAISGTVEHYYFNKQENNPKKFDDMTNFIGVDHKLWEQQFDSELTLNITEWNVKSSNTYNLGMRSAPTLLAQFQYMLEMEVDTAYVWPPQHNTSNDLAGSNQVIIDKATGIVVNSIGGAIYSMMAKSLPGLAMIEGGDHAIFSGGQTYLYANDERAVVYLASTSMSAVDISFDLEGIFGTGFVESTTRVGIDERHSNGTHYIHSEGGWTEADYVWVDGEKYYVNEHDVRAKISVQKSFAREQKIIEAELKPFEVLQIDINLDPYDTDASMNRIFGTDDSDQLTGTTRGDYVRTHQGNDIVRSLSGDDKIVMEFGHHIVLGGDGDDTFIFDNRGDGNFSEPSEPTGGLGDFIWREERTAMTSVIDGGNGHDKLVFSDGADAILSRELILDIYPQLRGIETSLNSTFKNIEEVYTGGGDDLVDLEGFRSLNFGQKLLLDAGEGNDIVWGSNADERILGGQGNDILSGGKGHNILSGGAGADTFRFLPDKDYDGGSVSNRITDFDPREGDVVFFGEFDSFFGASDGSNLVIENGLVSFYFSDGTLGLELEFSGYNLSDNDLSSNILII